MVLEKLGGPEIHGGLIFFLGAQTLDETMSFHWYLYNIYHGFLNNSNYNCVYQYDNLNHPCQLTRFKFIVYIISKFAKYMSSKYFVFEGGMYGTAIIMVF